MIRGWGAVMKWRDSRDNWNHAWHRLRFNLVGGVGLWGAGLLGLVFTEGPELSELVDNGQVILFSMGFLAPSLADLSEDIRIRAFPYRSILLFGSFFILIVGALLFAGAVTDDPPGINTGSVFTNVWFFRGLSTLIAVASLTLSFIVSYHGFTVSLSAPRNESGVDSLNAAAADENWGA